MKLSELPKPIEALILAYKHDFEELERFWVFCHTVFSGLGVILVKTRNYNTEH